MKSLNNLARYTYTMTRLVIIVGLIVLSSSTVAESQWEPTIVAFEERDKENAPPANAVLFVGSSSIVYWRSLTEDMAPLTVINRGFGGSQMFELNMFRDRIATNYNPKAIVVYEGDNDVAAGKEPTEILEQYRDFIAHVHDQLPDTDIFLIAVKPSIARAAMWETMVTVNSQLQQLAKQHDKVHYFDIATPMLKEDGSVKENLFVADGLHLNAAGYEVWTSVIRPVLLDRYGP